MLTSGQHPPLLPQRPSLSISSADCDEALSRTLSEFRPVAFNLNLARITQNAKAALMLSQLMYWTKRGTSVLECDGWIFKTRDQWLSEIGLGRHEQSTVRQTLIDLGLIEEGRVGHPARNCFRVLPQAIGDRLVELLDAEPVQWSLLDIRNDADHVLRLLGRNLAFYRVFVDITGSCINAMYLSKALDIHKRLVKTTTRSRTHGHDEAMLAWTKEWFRMAVPSTQAEIGLSEAQQRGARLELIRQGLLHEAMMEFPRKQIYLRIDTPTLQQKLDAALSACQNQPVDKNKVIHNAIGSDAKTSRPNIGKSGAPDGNGQNDSPVQTVQVSQTVQNTRGPEVLRHSSAKTDPPDRQLSHHSWPVLARPTAGFSMLSRQVLAPLHARDATCAGEITNYDYKEEIATTPTSPPPNAELDAISTVVVVDFELIWPASLSDWQRGQCQKILNPLAKTDQQDLLDELDGHLLSGGINNPVSYLGALTRKHQATPGGLVFEKLETTRQRRAVQQQIHGGSQGITATAARPDNALQSDHKPIGVPEYARALLRRYKGKI